MYESRTKVIIQSVALGQMKAKTFFEGIAHCALPAAAEMLTPTPLLIEIAVRDAEEQATKSERQTKTARQTICPPRARLIRCFVPKTFSICNRISIGRCSQELEMRSRDAGESQRMKAGVGLRRCDSRAVLVQATLLPPRIAAADLVPRPFS